MATGAAGTNGVWQYGEDDSNATFSALLNRAASTTDTQIGLDRGRITVLEGVKPGTAGKPFNMAASGATSSTAGDVTITFPAGRFNVAPIVTLAPALGPNAVVVPYVADATATNFKFSLFATTGTRVAQYANWTALQMTATTSGG